MSNDRFTLEERMTSILDIGDMIEDLMHMIGDSPDTPTEDQIINQLIGMKSTLNIRYERMWMVFEELIKSGVITNQPNEQCKSKT